MVPLGALWLPILLSAVFLFVASSVIWMGLQYHKSDYKSLPGEDSVLEALRKQMPSPGQYMFPYCGSRQAMESPEMVKKLEQGPVGLMIVRASGKFSMGLPLTLMFIYYLIVSLFVAYLTGRVLGAHEPYLHVFRVAGTTAILAYVGALFPAAIWYGKPWSIVARDLFDGVIYGLLTAGTFGWLWPR